MLKHHDLVIIGSGPAGQRAAIHAAKLGKTVLVVEKDQVGGACLHVGTIPSKTLREIAIEVHDTASDLLNTVMARKKQVIEQEAQIIHEQLERNGVDFVTGVARFIGKNEISVGDKRFTGNYFLIATGARPVRPAEIPFNEKCIFDSNTLLEMDHLPQSILVVGAGVIGCEYASILAQMGVKVTVSDGRPKILPAADPEIVEQLLIHFKKQKIELLLNSKVKEMREIPGKKPQVEVTIDGKTRQFEALLYCSGRVGNTDELDLTKAGLTATDKQLIEVNSHFQSKVPHIYAAGDVIGSPGLASASAEQGRIAASHIFRSGPSQFPDSFPYGIYTIPEISSVGLREEDCVAKRIQYVVGRANYRELARGKILNDDTGLLKLIVEVQSRKVLGVHIIGTGATELVHIGQVAISFGAEIDFFINNVFNYPTLAEAYKVAAYGAYNQLKGWCYLPVGR